MQRKIIVVDDNLACLSITKVMLSKFYTVVPVRSGEEFLKLVQKVPADLILLDIEMPVMNGFEVFEKLKEMAIGIPVFFLSGNEGDYAARAAEIGAAGYISKAATQKELVDRIEGHFSAH